MSLSLAGALLLITLGNDPFAENVRTTEPLSAEEQAQRFHVPDGFEVQLVASEPQIQKPMNLAFDARGRLWVSASVEYPYAAAGEGRDTIMILDDQSGDGRADHITTFADKLDIPIGLYPYRDGVVAYSISSIDWLRDTDGDDVADERQTLYGPLDRPQDTHGMQNAFRRGADGWLYVNHGFANRTTIAGSDGSQISLHSGNTYRIRLDGSRVEQHTWGQVNPFGSAWTELGDLVTADCHSKPLTLLLRGAYYSSFGKPHDGLGFGPELMSHHHGSTGLAGVAYYEDGPWPDEYRQNLFVGNVVTSRVHRDRLAYRGATPEAVELPDFLTCDDPWFRPVDVRFGPDGALYIADFYNRIIGHYEVPLEHPGRDRTRGRIWRVVYRGASSGDVMRETDATVLARASTDELMIALSSDLPAKRRMAMDQLSDRMGTAAVEPLRDALITGRWETVGSGWKARSAARWVLFRLDALTPDELLLALHDSAPAARVHALKIYAESSSLTNAQQQRVMELYGDSNVQVRRAAVQAMGRHPQAAQAERLLKPLAANTIDDPLLLHATKIALRDHVRDRQVLADLLEAVWDDNQKAQLVGIARAVPTAGAAELILRQLEQAAGPLPELPLLLRHVANHVSPEQIDRVARVARLQTASDLGTQVEVFRTLQESLPANGTVDLKALRDWGGDLVQRVLVELESTQGSLQCLTGDGTWSYERRVNASGQRTAFFSSFPDGETKTSRLVSNPFELPWQISFELCGHRGDPSQVTVPPGDRADGPFAGPTFAEVPNDAYVQLRLTETDRIVPRAYPPRHDHANRVTWDMSELAGQQAVIELVDQLDAPSYAWLAIANLRASTVTLPRHDLKQVETWQVMAAGLIGSLRLEDRTMTLRDWIEQGVTWTARAAAATERMHIADRPDLLSLSDVLTDHAVSLATRQQLAQTLAQPNLLAGDALFDQLVTLFQQLPGVSQQPLARRMSLSRRGAELLVELTQRGAAEGRLLQQGPIRTQIEAAGGVELARRVDELVANLPPLDEARLKVVMQTWQEYDPASADPASGKALFEKNCRACHQIAGQGALVGPQLDGIGKRGIQRLAEDVLTPHRNVDQAFRTTILTLVDGRVLSGLLREGDGPEVTMIDSQGKEIRVRRDEIDSSDRSPLSIMPDNFAELLNAQQRRDLLKFLSAAS